MNDVASRVMFRLRATRASPPRLANLAERRRTYGAAMAQFEELMTAAVAVTSASRPLPLFYALSQAGRAIAAAHAPERWQLRGHGLSSPGLDCDTDDILAIDVRRGKRRSREDDVADSFSGVSSTTGSRVFSDAVSLGSLWMSLPEVAGLLPPEVADRHPQPLRLVHDFSLDSSLVPWGRVDVNVVGYNGTPEELIELLGAHYPTAADARLFQVPGMTSPLEEHTLFGRGIRISFRADSPDLAGHYATMERVAGPIDQYGAQWLRPGVGGVAVSPLMSWWALLFGLSMLARYEPAGWTAALDLDSSPLAAALGQGLEVAVERIPVLVLDALVSGGQAEAAPRTSATTDE